MTRRQRFKYEMFVRVRDFGVAQAALFPEASKGSQAFARVLAAVAALDEQQKAHLLGLAEARRIKAATRDGYGVFCFRKQSDLYKVSPFGGSCPRHYSP